MTPSRPKPELRPVDPRESAYWWTGEYQSDPRYLAHLEAQQTA